MTEVMQQMLPYLDNSEMSDKSFMEKMNIPGGFKESALRLNKSVVLLNAWNEQHIRERANELAKKAESIWLYPSLTTAELAPYQVEEKTAQKYSLETYDVNIFTRILFESLDKRIMNLSLVVKKEYKKLYVAYKLDTNFVDIVFQKQRLRISINMKFTCGIIERENYIVLHSGIDDILEFTDRRNRNGNKNNS